MVRTRKESGRANEICDGTIWYQYRYTPHNIPIVPYTKYKYGRSKYMYRIAPYVVIRNKPFTMRYGTVPYHVVRLYCSTVQ